jgi:4-hydroxy-3-methylbut-2-enyl diphosphate reductase
MPEAGVTGLAGEEPYMQVRMAAHYGMCFGVRDAIELAVEVASRGPVTILGDLVHNPDVNARLDAAGALRVARPEQAQTDTVVVTAHGTSDRMRLRLREAGKVIQDATCPLVTRAHLALQKLVTEGYFPVVIGQPSHVEVRGMTGDLDDHLVIQHEEDVARLEGRFGDGDGVQLGIVAQTTQPIEHVRALVQTVRERLPRAEVRFIDTVCQPTKDRQEALRRLAQESDVVIVVGGPDSNNSRKLTELARKMGRPAYQVGGAGDLRREWFRGARIAGLTAGTSTPDRAIEEVRAWIEGL